MINLRETILSLPVPYPLPCLGFRPQTHLLAVPVQGIIGLAQFGPASRIALDDPCDRQIMCCELCYPHLVPAERNQGSRSSTTLSSYCCVLDFPSEPLTLTATVTSQLTKMVVSDCGCRGFDDGA